MTKLINYLVMGSMVILSATASNATSRHHLRSQDPSVVGVNSVFQKTNDSRKTPFPANPTLLSNPDKAVRSVSCKPARESTDADLILYEDFSGMTEGSEEEPGPNLTETDYFIPAEYTGEDGWWGIGVYSAGGNIALKRGVINTPACSMEGRLIITTRVKVMDTDSSAWFFVNCVKGSWMNPEAANRYPQGSPGSAVNQYTQSAEDGWVDVTTEVYNTHDGDDCWIQINSSYGNILIDEIRITRDYEYCTEPTNLMSYDFTDDGFTATWQPGSNNKSYLFTLMEERKQGDPASYKESFDDIAISEEGTVDATSLPEGYDIRLGEDGMQGTTNGGLNGSPALVLDSDDDFVMLPSDGNPIIRGSVYLKADVDADSYGMLYLIGSGEMGDKIAGGIMLTELQDGKTCDLYDYIDGLSNYTTLAFQTYYMSPGESVIIDDLTWSTAAPVISEIIREDEPVESNILILNGLNPDNDYSFSVKGVSEGGLVSAASTFARALGCPAPVALPAENIDCNGAYTACWIPSIKAEEYIIRNFQKETVKEAQNDYSVMKDSFTMAKDSGSDMLYLEGESFGDLTDLPGWTGYLAIYSGYGIGAMWQGDVRTPPMDLSNDGGRFKVRGTAHLVSGSGLVVQCDVSSFQTVNASPFVDDYYLEEYEFELEFSDGTDMSNIIFYSTDGNGFFINEIEILQNVEPGDRVITMTEAAVADGHDTSNYRFDDLTVSENFDYAYTVTAVASYKDTKFTSDPSELIPVYFTEVSVGEIESEQTASINVEGRDVVIRLAESHDVAIYDTIGRTVNSGTGEIGQNRFSIPAPGTYIIKAGSIVRKVTVR